ncbi:hypothetical protein D3C73_1166640 [compost metagenome]
MIQRHQRLLRFAGCSQRQPKVAEALRFLLTHRQHLLEHRHRQHRSVGLQQPVAEHAQQMAVVQIHLGQVGQHAQGKIALPLFDQQVGHVEEERAAVGVRSALGQIAVIQLRRRPLAQAAGNR